MTRGQVPRITDAEQALVAAIIPPVAAIVANWDEGG